MKVLRKFQLRTQIIYRMIQPSRKISKSNYTLSFTLQLINKYNSFFEIIILLGFYLRKFTPMVFVELFRSILKAIKITDDIIWNVSK